MLERLLLPNDHAIAILMHDHDTVKDLFDRFEKADSATEKEKIISKAIEELKIHAVIEEEIFYPAVRKHVGVDIMDEADEEHHVARLLIAELDQNRKDDHREAKFTVLAENVRHHIHEEESDMLPKAKDMDLDFRALGAQMIDRKRGLREDGIPADAEHIMVAAAGGRADTPAAASHRKPAHRTPKKAAVAHRKAEPKKQARKVTATRKATARRAR